MSHRTPSSSTSSLQSIERISQSAISGESQPHWESPYARASIHILDNDSLLNMFYIYRLTILDGDVTVVLRKGRQWAGEKWWYKLAHVCQRWRNLILGSVSYLGLCLVCTFGTPIADMLDHSPPLPLIIDYDEEDAYITAEDEEGIILSLEQRDRVRRIRLRLPVQTLQKLIMAINEEYPNLENLMLGSPGQGDAILILPDTLQAPHLRHLLLAGFSLPIGSRLLTTAVGLVTFRLIIVHPTTYFHPHTLLRWISFMPQLEILVVSFLFPFRNRDVERQLILTPITTHVTLPNLLTLAFEGASAYMEAVVRHITPPRLEKLEIYFPNQLTFSIPCLLQFMNTTENLRFNRARFLFSDKRVEVAVYPEEAKTCALIIDVKCWHLDWQQWSILPLNTGYIVSHRSSTMRSTAPSGANFLGRLAMRRPFASPTGSSGTSLVAYDWTMESSLWSSCPCCRSSQL
ncbi:hypothetical protein BGY98DRAFT_594254 [Russula aff. rugulosa BPL654]|nr:hypothetical protein BGY98DRAFT_594254 [Russula aff. rugulosa BPL654]